jgi:hypothetical protein
VDASVDELTAVLKAEEDGEGVLFAAACAGARALARQFLDALATTLAAGREPGWQVVGDRRRTVLTRFGAVRVRRRRYRRGRARRFLLDAALGWAPHQRVPPRLRALLVELASYLPDGRAAALAEQVGVASSGATRRRQLQAVGEAARAQEAARRQAVDAGGQPPPVGEEHAAPLFVEAEGVVVPLQRADERRAELKGAIAYRGTRAVGRDRHGRVRRATVGPVHDARGEEAEAFWESAWLAIGAR